MLRDISVSIQSSHLEALPTTASFIDKLFSVPQSRLPTEQTTRNTTSYLKAFILTLHNDFSTLRIRDLGLKRRI